MLWLSLCGTEDTSQSTGCLLKAQSNMSVTGRTLRIRTMAGTPIIQLCNRLFCAVSPALLLLLLTCSVLYCKCVPVVFAHCSLINGCIQYVKIDLQMLKSITVKQPIYLVTLLPCRNSACLNIIFIIFNILDSLYSQPKREFNFIVFYCN